MDNEDMSFLQEDRFLIDDEDLIENVKPNLISFTLSSSYSSQFSPEIQTLSVDDALKESQHTNGDGVGELHSSSDSILFLSDDCTKVDCVSSGKQPLMEANGNVVTNEHVQNCTKSLEGINEQVNVTNRSKQSTNRRSSISNSNISVQERKSLSLHDLRKLPSTCVASKLQLGLQATQSQSMLTVSKDSGFTRSLSCLSLYSGAKGYEHVQSKVKNYIQQIKEEDTKRRKKQLEENSNKQKFQNELETEYKGCEEILREIICKLEHDIQDRDDMLFEMQGNYNSLLLKYAQAENKIDRLRFKVIDSSVQEISTRNSCINDIKTSCTQDVNNQLAMHSISSESSVHTSSKSNSFQKTFQKQTTLNGTCVVDIGMQKCHGNDTVKHLIHNSSSESSMCKGNVVQSECALVSVCNKTVCATTEKKATEVAVNNSQLYCSSAEMNGTVPYKNEVTPLSQTPNYVERKEESNLKTENCIVKVRRWQESLPPVELMEPSCYGSLNGNASQSGTTSAEQKQKVFSNSGVDSGNPQSDLCNLYNKLSLLKCFNDLGKFDTNGHLLNCSVKGCDPLQRSSEPCDAVSATYLHKPLHRSDWFDADNFCHDNTEFDKPKLQRLEMCECWKVDHTKPKLKLVNKLESMPGNCSIPSLNLDGLREDTTVSKASSRGDEPDYNSVQKEILITCGECVPVPESPHRMSDEKLQNYGVDFNINNYNNTRRFLSYRFPSQFSMDSPTSYRSIQLNNPTGEAQELNISGGSTSSFLSSLCLTSENKPEKKPDLYRRKILGQQIRAILLKLLNNFEDLYYCPCFCSDGDFTKQNHITDCKEENSEPGLKLIGEYENTPSPHDDSRISREHSNGGDVMVSMSSHTTEVKTNVLKCLDEAELCAQEIKSHSDAIIRFLCKQMNIPPPRIAQDKEEDAAL